MADPKETTQSPSKKPTPTQEHLNAIIRHNSLDRKAEERLAASPKDRARRRGRLPKWLQEGMALRLDPHKVEHPALVAMAEAVLILMYEQQQRDSRGNFWTSVGMTIAGSFLGSFISLLLNHLMTGR